MSQTEGRGALDRLGRGLVALNALAALVAFVNGVLVVVDAPDDRLVVEGWRAFGFLVFAGVWALLALWPRRMPGMWEVAFFHKLALVMFAIVIGDVPEARTGLVVDSWLVVSTLAAWWMCRGWRSWDVVRSPAP